MKEELKYKPKEKSDNLFKHLNILFDLINEFERNEARKITKCSKPPNLITPKEFLTAINGNLSIKKDELFINPKNQNFKKTIEKIYKNKFSTKQKAAEILYFIIKNKNFKFENKKIALLCFSYFLEKNKLNKPLFEKEIRILFLTALLIEKSSASESNKMLNLIEKILID